MPKVAFVGDTSLRTSHFGCQLVGQTFREQFSRVGLDLIASLPTNIESLTNHESVLQQADLVVINGEGSIHDGRFQELINLAERYPCALVNCVYQNNPANPNLRRFRFISTRESLSARQIRAHGAHCEVVPDVLFASMFLNSYVPTGAPTLEIGITDCSEKIACQIGPFRFRYRPGYSPKRAMIVDYLNFLHRHRRLCIGRFHAAVAAAVLKIPFATWDSNTWKTRGMMADMGLPHLHFDDHLAARAGTPRELSPQVTQFATTAKEKIRDMFNTLATLT